MSTTEPRPAPLRDRLRMAAGHSARPADDLLPSQGGRITSGLLTGDEIAAAEAELNEQTEPGRAELPWEAQPELHRLIVLMPDTEPAPDTEAGDAIIRNLTRYGHACLLDAIAATMEQNPTTETVQTATRWLRITSAKTRG